MARRRSRSAIQEDAELSGAASCKVRRLALIRRGVARVRAVRKCPAAADTMGRKIRTLTFEIWRTFSTRRSVGAVSAPRNPTSNPNPKPGHRSRRWRRADGMDAKSRGARHTTPRKPRVPRSSPRVAECRRRPRRAPSPPRDLCGARHHLSQDVDLRRQRQRRRFLRAERGGAGSGGAGARRGRASSHLRSRRCASVSARTTRRDRRRRRRGFSRGWTSPTANTRV